MIKNQILCKWATNGEQGEAKFDTVADMFAHRMYNSFNFINMCKCGATEMPPYLPQELQILRFDENKIFKLPHLPITMHSISGINNRLTDFPDTSACINLEDINLSGNEIIELDAYVSENLKTINLDFNRLLFIAYHKLPLHTKLSVSYNFLKQCPPAPYRQNVKFDHNDIPDKVYHQAVMGTERPNAVIPVPIARPLPQPTAPLAEPEDRFLFEINQLPEPFRYLPPAPARIEYAPINLTLHHTTIDGTQRIAGTDSQSVHNSSVQKSANKSLEYVLKYEPKRPIPEDLITEVITAYKENKIKKSRMRRAMKCISRSWAASGMFVPPIRNWCIANDIHSNFGVTYKTLLKQVWAIIQDHPHKEELIDVLSQELDASEYVCFTGRFTRTLNALTGFIEEVQIGLSTGEQMQNRITMAIKNCKEKLGDDFQAKAREEVKGILMEFEVPVAEQEAWLDAIE